MRPLENKRVLLVDDDPYSRRMLRQYLLDAGCEVLHAGDGKAALAALGQTRPDLICLELVLPDVSGYELCAHVRGQAALKDVPVLVVSIRTNPADRAHAEEVGATSYLLKPVTRSAFISRVESLLRPAEPSAAPALTDPLKESVSISRPIRFRTGATIAALFVCVLGWEGSLMQVAGVEKEPAGGNLGALARRRIYFGHQSVGDNLLQGVAELAAGGGPAPRVVETGDPGALVPGVWAHQRIGKNGDPEGKIADFAARIRAGIGGRADVALMKLCYADFTPTTPVDPLFARYRDTLDQLAREFPSTRFVHVTVPLTAVQHGPKAWLNRLLGRPVPGERENAQRERFNALLRSTYAGREPVFDLASLEATRPDGSLEEVPGDTGAVLALSPAWASDEGHLNRAGRLRLAAELVRCLAAQQPAAAVNR